MPLLFSPLQLRGVTLKNRIVVSPMCQYSAIDGFANDWHLVHLGSRAVGGAGLVIVEATAVTPEGRISPHDLGLWSDDHVAPLKRITTFIEAQGSVPAIQLAHAGRKSSLSEPWNGDRQLTVDEGGWQTVAPSALAFAEDRATPQELTVSEIQSLVASFVAATKRALTAGFKVLEIHGAHGYLINGFLSPLSNKRTDDYGGSFENRTRFLRQIIEGIRSVWADDLPLFLRISASDWEEGGWTVEDSKRLAELVGPMGVDLVDCSSGGNSSTARIPAKPGYQVPFAAEVRKTGMPTGAVGIIVTAQQAEEILVAGEADLIFMARELLRDPYFPIHAAQQLGYDDMAWPVQYERAKRKK
ncbi:MAG: NADH:flavin oxidoreductase/NADH oxidase [Taibaiella sp.]|nr:NADH:flavin oxidoreductase/NADH oxidase [Taibaiella sp.]